MSEESAPRGWRMYADKDGNITFEVDGKKLDCANEEGKLLVGVAPGGCVIVHHNPFPYRDHAFYEVFRTWDAEREKRWERDNPDGTYIPKPTKEQWLERCAEFYDYLFSLRG